ncbi:MAG TPA: HepT-like ribonuclease domain-containing protein [Acetobacteraceae bacterium]|nr:HepT-like ribonuclease domain-containing protein [Acetobacteraceae bacterium]
MIGGLVRPVLRAILDATDGIQAAVRAKSLDDFSADRLLRHGVQRGIEIVSDTTRRIPPDQRASQPHVPWARIMGIGNMLRHEYHRVSDTVVWSVAQHHPPPLKVAVEAIGAAPDAA